MLRDAAEDEKANNDARRAIEGPYLGDDTFAQEELAILEAMIASPGCETVWKALEARRDPNAKTRRQLIWDDVAFERSMLERAEQASATKPLTYGQKLLRLELEAMERAKQGNPEPEWDGSPGQNIGDMAEFLIGLITQARSEKVPTDTKGVRTKRLAAVKKAADKLAEAIAPYTQDTTLQLRRLRRDSAIATYGRQAVDKSLWQIMRFEGRDFVVTPEEVAISYTAADHALESFEGILDAMVEDVATWAAEEPVIDKPGHPNAARTLFINRMTFAFRMWLGQPLRGTVLAIVQALFEDSESMTEASIAQLAP